MTRTIFDIYREKCAEPSDINELLPVLNRYARGRKSVTEFGVRGIVSTWALLAGHPQRMTSYDLTHPGEQSIQDIREIAWSENIDFEFITADVRNIEIVETEFLFIDTYHTYSQLTAELTKHAGKVTKYIAMHDTVTFGDLGEASSERGLNLAIDEFLMNNRSWQMREKHWYNNGLTVVERI